LSAFEERNVLFERDEEETEKAKKEPWRAARRTFPFPTKSQPNRTFLSRNDLNTRHLGSILGGVVPIVSPPSATRYTTERMTRLTLSFLSLVLTTTVLATEPPKPAAAAPKGNIAAKDSTASAASPNSKAKKKKLLRPGIEWEPAPAPLKW